MQASIGNQRRAQTYESPREKNSFNDPGGSRTHDLRIKSPLLYQLSYRVR